MAVYQPQAVQMMPMQAQPVGMPMQGQAMYAQQQPVVMAAPGVMAMQQPLVQGQFQTTELDCWCVAKRERWEGWEATLAKWALSTQPRATPARRTAHGVPGGGTQRQ